MTIDNAEKRRSAAMVGVLGLLSGPGVTPDTALDSQWRQQVAYGYSGIPVTVGLLPWWMLPSIVRPAIPTLLPQVVISLFPAALAFQLIFTAQAGYTRTTPIPRIAGQVRLSISALLISRGQPLLISGRIYIRSHVLFYAGVGMREVMSGRVGLHDGIALRSIGQGFWPHEGQELRLLGLGGFLAEEDIIIIPALSGRGKN